jgi:hypothetical protein
VQYVAHPASTWNVLRESYPEVYENPVSPPPDPDGWVTLRLEVEEAEVRAYVGTNTKIQFSLLFVNE